MDRFQGNLQERPVIYIYMYYNGYVLVLKSRFLQNHPGSCFAGLNGVGCTKLWPFYDNHASLWTIYLLFSYLGWAPKLQSFLYVFVGYLPVLDTRKQDKRKESCRICSTHHLTTAALRLHGHSCKALPACQCVSLKFQADVWPCMMLTSGLEL